MIFTRIEIENFGIFRGKHVFDLNPPKSKGSRKPIVLIGGKNGSGKTTIFEAIRLCLYGEFFKGNKLSKLRYHKHLLHRINRYAYKLEENSLTSICVEFEYGRFGHVDTYLIRRSWKYFNGKLVTTLEVCQNGKPLKDVYEKQWQDFVKELVPIGVSRLFFFDGEQIQNIAEDEVDNRNLINSIHSLLGLDLVDRLHTDLRIYLSKKVKEQSKELANDITKHEKKQISLEEKLDALIQERAKIQSLLDRVNAEIEDQEHKIALEGGGYAYKREELKIRREKLEVEIERTKDEIRKLSANLLPFALVPDLCCSLRKRLSEEEEYRQKVAAKTAIESIAQSVFQEMNAMNFWQDFPISLKQREELANRVLTSFKRRITSKDEETIQIIHPISSVDRKKILNWIDRVTNQVPEKLRRLSSNLENLSRQRQDVVTQLYRAPPNEVIHPFVQKINELHTERGVLQEKYRYFENEAGRIRNELTRVGWEIDKLLAQEAKFKKQSECVALARKVQNVLNEFVARLRIEKIDEVCEKFLECFKLLSNKGDLIERMGINLDAFQIELWEVDKEVKITKSELSAGEKQIFAIAMLWALARVSGRPLPFMIDTPLGRLDKTHRERIVEKFFPNASHQVILFSTDTEIDNQLFQKLQPNIAKAYHLQYNESIKTSCASQGYFWISSQSEVYCN